MRLILVRHGQTIWNADRRAQGHTDIELNDVGKRQAEMVGSALKNRSIGKVLSSDLIRASETAAVISRHTNSSVDLLGALREQSFGEWEGLDYREIGFKFRSAKQDNHLVRPPGGESKDDVWQRLTPVVENVRKSMFDTVIVSHGGVTALLITKLLCGTPDMAASFKFSNASITELERMHDGRFKLLSYDSTVHLKEIETSNVGAHGVLG
jgi:broad specificity phosphatase PhoE